MKKKNVLGLVESRRTSDRHRPNMGLKSKFLLILNLLILNLLILNLLILNLLVLNSLILNLLILYLTLYFYGG